MGMNVLVGCFIWIHSCSHRRQVGRTRAHSLGAGVNTDQLCLKSAQMRPGVLYFHLCCQLSDLEDSEIGERNRTDQALRKPLGFWNIFFFEKDYLKLHKAIFTNYVMYFEHISHTPLSSLVNIHLQNAKIFRSFFAMMTLAAPCHCLPVI